ncbi:FtsK/SpoIIIE domain-containing protein [Phytohabitans rumicis]|uniref:FtsK domain-containing protein n=1 Tax=Phytohabitans rumicis TaxID=1076125 RepID=A0A6V8KY26_9ACTN|nr:FtsK/SpoIIIE domain-containing protein [Phytohabitans rumicis]GFJ86716.1 hypothetical protein Prum_003580 [Phytohabitans rumicis]
MRLSVRAASTTDVTLEAFAADGTVAELLGTLARRFPEQVGDLGPRRPVDLDGFLVAPDAFLANLPLRAGSVLTVPPSRTRTAPARKAPPAVVDLVEVAGPDGGVTLGLSPGAYLLGRGPAGLAFGGVRRPVLRIEVDRDGGCVAEPVADDADPDACPVRLDGRPLPAGEAAECGPGSVLTVGEAVFRLAPARPRQRADRVPQADADAHGRIPLIRTPRMATPPPPAEVQVPPPPTPGASPIPMSWLVMLAPLPIGVAMALMFSPFFLIMTAMTPLMGLARWIEGKYRARKDARRIAAESAEAAARFAEDLDAVRMAVAAAARAAHPDLGELRRRCVTGGELWQVRPGDPDELRVCVGIGDLPWRPELARPADALRTVAALTEALAERSRLVDVPILVDLRERGGLGVVGADDGGARRSAAAVVLDLVTRHGPADLSLALLVEPALLPEWEWAKWLPHLTSDDGSARLATDPDAAAALLSSLAGAAGAPPATATSVASVTVTAGNGAGRDRPRGPAWTVVLVDGDRLLTGAVAALLGRLRGGRAIVVASSTRRLPSVCQSIMEIGTATGVTTATLTDAVTGGRVVNLHPIQATPAVCTGAGRALARWTDPEQAVPAALLPDQARLVDQLLTAASGPDGLGRPVEALDAPTIAGLWRRGVDGLRATLGVTERGPLTVDLLSDGPHGLIVGTTGAGKSELLRTLVASLACLYSPDQLTFLLVDFKGGGAFDACAGLPHTVGMVTDLDEHLAARALRCLRAELRHRERRLREAGVSDLRDYLAPSPALPRLVIVIDEFATLAVELPGFLSALVDVAQRGRSLGIHLLLATQRPQGVVDGKIRANTNLRVALRVQDETDSRDVIGTRHAADLDRRRPGRGYVRFGAGEIVALQSALVSAPAVSNGGDRIEVGLFELAPSTGAVAEQARPPAPDDAPTDLQALVAATVDAVERVGCEPPRVPWPAPLPDVVDAWTLPDRGDSEGTGDAPPVPLGLVDLPDEQRSDLWWWQPEAGGALVLGADAAATTAVLATACLGLARSRQPEQLQIFILDGSGCGLTALAGLPHVAAAVGVDDAERLSRILDWLDAELGRRRGERRDDAPEIVLVVAGWGAVIDAAERAGLPEVTARLERLLRDGGPLGVRLLLSAAHERAVPGRVLTQLPTKLCLRLADPASYTALGLRAREVPELRGLRAIDLQARHELTLGRYGDGSAAALAAAAARVAGRHPDAAATPAVGVLPETVPAADVLGASTTIGGTWRLGIGRYYRDLAVAALELAPGMHAVVAGPPTSGRTTALRVLAAAARMSEPQAPVCVVTPDPATWQPGEATEIVGSFEELRHWPAEGPALLLVDGVEALGPAAAAALDRLVPAAQPAAHVIVAGRGEAFRGMRNWQRAITMSRTGLLLRPAPDDGEILRTRLPREQLRSLPGRGYLVDAGGLTQIQVALVATPAEPDAVPVGGVR